MVILGSGLKNFHLTETKCPPIEDSLYHLRKLNSHPTFEQHA